MRYEDGVFYEHLELLEGLFRTRLAAHHRSRDPVHRRRLVRDPLAGIHQGYEALRLAALHELDRGDLHDARTPVQPGGLRVEEDELPVRLGGDSRLQERRRTRIPAVRC